MGKGVNQLGGLLAMLVTPSLFAFELAGQLNVEHRQFLSHGLQGQSKGQSSVVVQPELYWDFQSGDSSFTFTPFFRVDSLDDERTHGDIREALFLTYWDDYELRVGISKVFWGVTESAHLVDVVNQTDAVEAVDGEDKLGQPMVHFTAIKDWALFMPWYFLIFGSVLLLVKTDVYVRSMLFLTTLFMNRVGKRNTLMWHFDIPKCWVIGILV